MCTARRLERVDDPRPGVEDGDARLAHLARDVDGDRAGAAPVRRRPADAPAPGASPTDATAGEADTSPCAGAAASAGASCAARAPATSR